MKFWFRKSIYFKYDKFEYGLSCFRLVLVIFFFRDVLYIVSIVCGCVVFGLVIICSFFVECLVSILYFVYL